ARAIYAGSAAELPLQTGDERLGRNELRRQIARLESLLASYPGVRKPGEPTHPLLRPKGHVADMAELERKPSVAARGSARRAHGSRRWQPIRRRTSGRRSPRRSWVSPAARPGRWRRSGGRWER